MSRLMLIMSLGFVIASCQTLAALDTSVSLPPPPFKSNDVKIPVYQDCEVVVPGLSAGLFATVGTGASDDTGWEGTGTGAGAGESPGVTTEEMGGGAVTVVAGRAVGTGAGAGAGTEIGVGTSFCCVGVGAGIC